MAKQLYVSMSVDADTSKARSQLAQLQKQLDSVINSTVSKTGKMGLTTEIQGALNSATQLKVMLEKAVNVNTGNLDLSKFSKQLKANNIQLESYAKNLTELGPDGERAFAMLAKSIVSAEVPLKKANTTLTEFWTTLKNTARWQISSSVMHGFIGALKSAEGYAKDLDKSLNNIRIVTSNSVDEMAKFAKQANQAAKELNTTTTKYTDAALIFYQQGLTDEIVKEYTDVTIKMANVTKDSASDVSSYMTAIWNNFKKDGTESAEHFADVLTALGAATASSTAEISAGLEKFASIADVTGLSYDYAASALATLIANTRQSADVVGTSLKTIFSRMEGLKLGETLEDGVDLNKYSEALQTIGVNVLDASGNLKDLDDILDDTAAKWDTLSRAQQMATAQTVAGVRQYNNFISLMDNWDDMKDNLQTAKTSDGALQEQADIYAESWEASRDRVRASLEAIYSDLVDEKFFTGMNDAFADTLDIFDHFLDSIGGVKGALSGLGMILTKVFATQIADSFNQSISNLSVSLGKARMESEQLVQESVDAMYSFNKDMALESAEKMTQTYRDQVDLAKLLREQSSSITKERKEYLQTLIAINEKYGEHMVQLNQEKETNAQNIQSQEEMIRRREVGKDGKSNGNAEIIQKSVKEYQDLAAAIKTVQKSSQAQQQITVTLGKSYKDVNNKIKAYNNALKSGDANKIAKAQEELTKAISDTGEVSLKAKERASLMADSIKDQCSGLKMTDAELEKYLIDIIRQVELKEEASTAEKNYNNNLENTRKKLSEAQAAVVNYGQSLTTILNGLSSFGMAISSISSLKDTLTDEDLSPLERFGQLATSLSMTLFSLKSAYAGLAEVKTLYNSLTNEENLIVAAVNLIGRENLALTEESTIEDAKLALIKQAVALGLLEEGADVTALNGALTAEIILKTIINSLDKTKIATTVAIIAVLGILIGLTVAITNAMHAQAEAEKENNQIAADAKERYEDLKNAYEDLKTSIEDYEGSLEAFQKLESSADGYADALENLNEKARELIETNGLFNDWYYGNNGEILFKPGALDEALSGAEARSQEAFLGYNSSQLMALQTRERGLNGYIYDGSYGSDKNGDGFIGNDGDYTGEFGNGYGNETTFLTADQIQSMLVSLSKEQLEAIQNSGLSSWTYDQSLDGDDAGNAAHTYEEQLNDLAKQLKLTNDETLILCDTMEYMGDDALETIDKLKAVSDEEKFYREQEALAITQKQGLYKNDINAQNAYANLLSQQDDYISASRKNADKAATGSEAEIKRLLADRDDKWSNYNDGLGTNGTLTDKELMQAYAQYVEGWTTEMLDKATYSNGWGKGILTSGDEKLQVSDSQMRKALEAQLLADEMAKNSDDTYDDSEIQQTIQAALQASSDVSNTLLNALSNYTAGEDKKMDLDWSLISPEDAEEMLQVAEDMGDTYSSAVKEALDGYTSDKYFDRLEQQQSEAIDKQISDNELDADVIATQTELLQENTEALEDNKNAAKQLAVNNARMNKGMSTLIDNWKDWKKVLQSGDKTTAEYAETVTELKKTMGDLVGLSEEMANDISASFFDSAENMDLLERAANADADAVTELGFAVGKDLINNLEALYTLTENGKIEVFDGQTFNSVEELDSRLNELKSNISGYMDQIQQSVADGTTGIGDSLSNALGEEDMANFVNSLNEMAKYTQMSVADMQGLLNTMGIDAQVDVDEVTVDTSVPQYTTTYKKDGSLIGFATGMSDLKITSSTSVTGYEDVQEKRQVASISYDGSKPHTSINYVGHGGASHGNKASAAKKSGGGGGGSSNKAKKEDRKILKDEIDRYHEINNELDDISDKLEKISAKYGMVDAKSSKAFGAGKLKLLKKQQALLDSELSTLQKQADAYDRLAKEQKQYLSKDASNASKYGWTFDKNGNVNNYDEQIAALIKEYNDKVATYNKLSADEQSDSTILTDAQEAYNKAIEALKKYEETKEAIEDTEKDILKNKEEQLKILQQSAELALEGVELIVDLRLEVDEAQLKYLQALFDNIGDSADYAADKIENIEKQIAKYNSTMEDQKQGLEDYLKLAQQYSDGLSDDAISNIANGTASDSDLQALAKAVSNSDGILDMNTIMEKVKDFQSACYDNIEQLKEWRDSVYETLQDAMDQYDETFDRIDNKIAHSSVMIQNYKDLVAAIGKKNIDPTGQLTARMDQNAIKTSESAYRASQAQSEYWKKAVADAQEGLAAAKATGVEADIKYWEDILNNATDKLYESEEDAMDKLDEWVTQLGEAFQHQIEQVIDNLNQSLGGLSDLREAFDRAQEIDAQYIDDYQKIYELSKLTRQVNTSIDETDNVKAKKALMEYQQKINEYQADGVQMSEYELEYLQKQYDLELAKIALDEAKDAKSKVRMTRDAEGNYGYVYTADESAVEKAEQSYEDKLYEMQELNAQYINDLQDNIITMQEEMSAKLQEIAEDDSLSYEEKMAKMQEVTDYYSERIDYYSKQLGIVIDNNKSLYENDWKEYSEKTGYKISKDEDYIDSWGETTIAVQTGAETQEEYIANVKNGMQVACDDMQDALSDYQQAVRDATDEVIDGAAEQTDALAETAEEAAGDAEELEEDYENTLGEAMDATQQFTEDYATYINDCIQANLDYIDSINDVLAKLRELAAEEGSGSGKGKGSGEGDKSGKDGDSGSGGKSGSGGGSGAGSVEGVAAAIWMDGGVTSGWYNGNDRTSRLKEKGLTAAQAYINAHGPNGDIYAAWHNKREQLKSFYYGSFDTGGYTGEWGDGSGKLALLHSKELVLNAADTENMLKMVDMVRQISNMIDINALSSSLTSGLTAASVNANNNGVLEQQVTITAEFPNATDKDQILDAFDNVINLAAQYANRK